MSSSDLTRIPVGGSSPYEVVIGENALTEIPGLLSRSGRVAVIHCETMKDTASDIADAVRTHGPDVDLIAVPDGEAAKNCEVATHCWTELASLGFTRSDAIVAVGGGATTDLAGFVAATWLRGVPIVHVPTSLTAMVDAAIGGKTAINIPAGKNLVGAYHSPVGVVCDLTQLSTLPEIELVNGLAEIVRVGFIADPSILDIIEADTEAVTTPCTPPLRDIIERSARVKAEIVTEDMRDKGRRQFLNYGHTLGHAIEQDARYQWRHGSAVSVGMCYAAELGRLTGHLDDATAARHAEILMMLGLPTTYRPDAWPDLLKAMRIDKKARGSRMRFVVLDGLGAPTVINDPDEDVLVASYAPCCRVMPV
ncbi:3-dehydroquinate synthase [Actinophytocola sp.]|uniref:3-dehydroquinate synthase n=1 Tax=Actinophytocola sp. TaxID=1872138 RepID=UPI002ED6258B